MSPPPEVVGALLETSELCAEARKTISGVAYGQTSADVSTSPLLAIRTDFLSILALVRAHSTTLSLAFKPPPTYHAASRPLSDLRADVTKLAGSIRMLAASKHGATFYEQTRSRASVVLEAIQALVQTFQQTDFDNPVTSRDDKTYLLRMGSLHSAVDETKSFLPDDNLSAVLQTWSSNSGIMKDALVEYEELSEVDEDGEREEDDFGDEMDTWDDVLGLESSEKLTPKEAAVSKKCWGLARMVHVLHERVASRHLPTIATSDPSALDSLLASSSGIVEAIDDLTVTLYGPQIHAKIAEALQELGAAVHTLRDQLYLLSGVPPPSEQSSLEEAVASLSLDAEKQTHSKDVQWLIACFAQVDKSIAALL